MPMPIVGRLMWEDFLEFKARPDYSDLSYLKSMNEQTTTTTKSIVVVHFFNTRTLEAEGRKFP